jgi:hypothetical protein
MICEQNQFNGYFYDIKIDANDLITLLRALYWYQDKVTNTQRSKGRDDAEWDSVIYMRQQLSEMIKHEAKIL